LPEAHLAIKNGIGTDKLVEARKRIAKGFAKNPILSKPAFDDIRGMLLNFSNQCDGSG